MFLIRSAHQKGPGGNKDELCGKIRFRVGADPGNDQPVIDYVARYGDKLSGNGDINIDLERVPEASMVGALAMGTLGLAMLSRRKRNRAG